MVQSLDRHVLSIAGRARAQREPITRPIAEPCETPEGLWNPLWPTLTSVLYLIARQHCMELPSLDAIRRADLISVRSGVSLGVSFSRQTPILMSERIGTDARFPYEVRQIVVIG